jgi:acetyl esterase/lipase
MAGVARLLTLVDIDDVDEEGPNARRMSVTARQEALLEDGRRVVLLDDRGWSGQLGAVWTDDAPPPEGWRETLPSTWAFETVEELERTARDVVGPDEPVRDSTQAEIEASHWEALASILREHGVEVEAAELRELPHDVELSTRLRARVSRAPGDAS